MSTDYLNDEYGGSRISTESLTGKHVGVCIAGASLVYLEFAMNAFFASSR